MQGSGMDAASYLGAVDHVGSDCRTMIPNWLRDRMMSETAGTVFCKGVRASDLEVEMGSCLVPATQPCFQSNCGECAHVRQVRPRKCQSSFCGSDFDGSVGHVVRITTTTTKTDVQVSGKVWRTTVYVTIAAHVEIATTMSKAFCAQCVSAVHCSRPMFNLMYMETC
jgi:hypothetical protein